MGNLTIYFLTRVMLAWVERLNSIIFEINDPGVIGKITSLIEDLEDVAKRLDRLE